MHSVYADLSSGWGFWYVFTNRPPNIPKIGFPINLCRSKGQYYGGTGFPP